MLIAYVPLLFVIVSALIYALSANGKVQALALHTYLAAMVALMLALSHSTWRIGSA